MMSNDLAAARAAWIDEASNDARERQLREESGFLAYRNESGTADFHSTRHSFITLLAKNGIHPKMAQTLARHSTISLTLDRYTHVSLFDQATALQSLPSLHLAGIGPSAGEAIATGTDGRLAGRLAGASCKLTHSTASDCTGTEPKGMEANCRKCLKNKP